jgi:exosortase family protein XrtF
MQCCLFVIDIKAVTLSVTIFNRNMQIPKIPPFQGFFINAIILYLIWLAVFYYWGEPRGGFDDAMTTFTGNLVNSTLQIVGYDMKGVWKYFYTEEYQKEALQLYLQLDGQDVIRISNRCNALFTIAIYVGFILAYPGAWKPKVAFITLGTLAIISSNVIRVSVLALNWIYYRSTFDFNHKYTYTFVLYSVVFLLWMWWVNKYALSMAVKADAK